MQNQFLRRTASVLLSLAMLLCMAPETSFGAAVSNSSTTATARSPLSVGATDSDRPVFVEGEAVILYEDETVDTLAPSTSREKKKAGSAPKAKSFGTLSASEGSQAREEAENTLGQQTEILDQSIEGDYVIEDTIVLDADSGESEKVISIISSDSMDTETLVDRLNDNDNIRIAEPNYIYHATAMPAWNDTYLQDAWQLAGDNGVHADAAWESEDFSGPAGSDPVVVAVIDTGIDYTHPDITARMWTKPESKAFRNFKGAHGYDFVYGTSEPMDENGHGTHCSGIIAGIADNSEGIVGVAGNSDKIKLLGVRVLDEDGYGSLSDIVAGFKYVIRLKKAGANIRVINCSLGADTTSDIFDAVIEQAGQAGVLTVAAAGNESSDNDVVPSSPANAKSDYLISVAASDENGSFSSYSNYGKKNVDITAPGSNILSSVSYDNFAPYLYDTDTLQKTTDYYGEFGGAEVSQAVNAQGETVDTVRPVPGTDYSGEAITNVGEFGNAVLLSNRTKGSSGLSSLELTDSDGFCIGNNQTSLRWKISGAVSGDEYILYFPYDKVSGSQDEIFMNLTFRPHTDAQTGGIGSLDVGDVIINGIDKNNRADWSTLVRDEMGFYQLDVDPSWNSIWQASGTTSVFYPYSIIKGLKNNTASGTAEGSTGEGGEGSPSPDDPDSATANASGYGIGMVYQAMTDGDVYFDISSMGISRSLADIDENTSFGQYDVYSGTSMAAPVAAGSAALLSIMNPDMSAEQIRNTLFASIDDVYDGWCSTGGRLDLASYTPAEDDSRPSIGSAVCDFKAGTVTLKGRGFGSSPKVTVTNNISGVTEVIPVNDISTSGKNIVIRNAGARTGSSDSVHHGIIGSDITFTVDNNGRKGQGTFYAVKGLAPYRDGYDIPMLVEEDFSFFSKGSEDTDDGELPPDGEMSEDEPSDPVMMSGLTFLTGSNDLYMYDSSGAIHRTEKNESGQYVSSDVGTSPDEGVREYVRKMLEEEDAAAAKDPSIDKSENLWRPDDARQEKTLDYFTVSVIGNPVYMGGSVYELVRADLGYREACLLMGMRLDDENGEWRVFYDSLAGLGTAPSELDFGKIDSTTLAGYRGRIYILGSLIDPEYDPLEDDEEGDISGEDGDEEEFYEFTEDDVQTEIFSCAPVSEGSNWRKEAAALPAPRALGYAAAQGGNLYYVLSSTGEDVDYNVYKFDGKAWSVAGSIPKALYLGERGVQVVDLGFFTLTIGGHVGIPCAVSIDEKGILFGGMSFDGTGDTFRFNTATKKTEPLGYTLWGDTADRTTDGIAAGNNFWIQYNNDVEERIIGKNIPIRTGYVRLARTIDGEGSGIVTGGEYCPKGEATDVTIVPDEGCYIYSISSRGVSPALKYAEITSNIAKTVQARRKTVRTSFPATANGKLDIVFGKISTSITAKAAMTKAVGKRDLDIFTDGTISDVSLKSSNTKYAKVNKDGTVTFNKAGVGKTVKITATALDNPSVRKTVTVKIISRKAKKFTLGKYKISLKSMAWVDQQLGKAYTPRKLKAKSASKGKSVRVTWKKAKKSSGIKGYIILRKTGKGRFVQIATLKAGKTAFTDKKVKKGRKYQYTVVGYRKAGKALMLTPAPKAKAAKVRRK